MVKPMGAQRDDEGPQRWRAAHTRALHLAQRLREAAAVIRRYAGELKYHPQTGVEGHIGQDLLEAVATIRQTLEAISTATAGWDEELVWLRARGAQMRVDDIEAGHAAVRDAARLVGAALAIFEQAALHPEPAVLDAPYGTGAPRRVHPGAQCTWVAERAEKLALELSSVTLRKENRLLLIQSGTDEPRNP